MYRRVVPCCHHILLQYTVALLTKLKMQDIQDPYLVVGFRCRYSRKHNGFHPTTSPACEQMEITVVAPENDDFLFYEWFTNRGKLSGSLSYELPVSPQNGSGEKRVIDFSDAGCLSVSEHYDISDRNRRLITVVIVPDEVKIDDINVKHL